VKHKQEEVLDYWDEEYDEYDESEYEEEDPGNRPVPIWLCSSLVISYIIGGAFLFSSWESWNFLDSAYFCFITLTTIGQVFHIFHRLLAISIQNMTAEVSTLSLNPQVWRFRPYAGVRSK